MVEQDCHLSAEDTKDHNEDDLVVQSNVLELSMIGWLDWW